MNFDRIDRISEEVRREVDRILREDVRDPRVKGTWSVTRVDVTRDLKYAKVRVSVLEDEAREPLIQALRSAAGFVRRELGRAVSLRYTPELLFEADQNIAYGAHISELLAQVMPKKQEDEDGKPGGAEETD